MGNLVFSPMKRKLLALIICVVPLALAAQDQRTVTNVQSIGFGAASLLDTYLSQENYNGWEIRYQSHTTRERSNSRWSSLIIHQGLFNESQPRSNDGRELGGLYVFNYGRRYRLTGDQSLLQVSIGGMGEVGIGFLYNTRNSNNPAQARCYLNLSPSAAASYPIRLRRMVCVARYEVSLPLLGVLFSPNYGQSYYEIFSRGNYDHNLVVTTPFNAPSLRHTLSVDIPVGRYAVRVGYLGDYQQAKVNDLKYHTYSHLFLLGLVRHFSINHLPLHRRP